EKKKEVTVKVDIDGIQDRILRLPITPANYRDLGSIGNTVYYVRTSRKDAKPAFLMYDLGAKKETELGSVAGYEISADKKKMLVSQGGSYYIIDLPKASISPKDALSLSGLQVNLDRRAEWRQIFHECWRQMRDFFYDPNLHGVEWKTIRDRYAALLPYVNHRADLTYIIGEMIAELNCSHAYVGGGDMPHPQRILTGLLGATLRHDPKSKTYQITKILKGSNWDKELRSPLAEIGVNLSAGDFILAVNGKPTSEMTNIYEALVNTVGKQVRLKVNSKPEDKGSREITIVPIADEQPLY